MKLVLAKPVSAIKTKALKNFIIISIFFLFVGCSTSSHHEYWTTHWNEDSTLFGFKSENGRVEIEPKFIDYSYVSSFDNFNAGFEEIIAVGENNDGAYRSYYLSKSGHTFGQGNVYVTNEVRVDCESEGFIRFIDHENDKIGMFDKSGKIAIPAVYDELSRVHNGLVYAIKNAEKFYYDESVDSSVFIWINGDRMILDTKNKILIKNFEYKKNYRPINYLDLYSLNISELADKDTTKYSFLGVNGLYYTFSDFKLEFEEWVKTELLTNLNIESFNSISSDSITFRGAFNLNDNKSNWTTTGKTEFFDANFKLIKKRILESSQPNAKWFGVHEPMNELIFNRVYYSTYFDNCGNSKYNRYPVLILVVNTEKGDQDKYYFLESEEGYKFIGATTSRWSI